MKSSPLLCAFVTLLLVASLDGQSSSLAKTPPLGLPRLMSERRPNQAAPLASETFAVDELSASGVAGAIKGTRSNADYLALDAGSEWSRPLRGTAADVTFVSFQVYASQTTIIDITGIRLGLTAGPVPDSLQLMFDEPAPGGSEWKPLNYHVATGKYDGRNFAAVPTLTVRIDPSSGVWDLFSGSRLLADNLPLIDAKKNDRQIRIRAGTEGAWITGLVLSDENPIYEDANANGIDDVFEISRRGALLPANATIAERQFLAKEWKDSQRTSPPPAFFVHRPSADEREAGTPPET